MHASVVDGRCQNQCIKNFLGSKINLDKEIKRTGEPKDKILSTSVLCYRGAINKTLTDYTGNTV